MDQAEGETMEGGPAPVMDSGGVVKQEPPWSMIEESPDQPSAVYSTVQPMSDSTSGSVLSLNTSHVCQHCSAPFVLVSSLSLHMASCHGESVWYMERKELPVSSGLHGLDKMNMEPDGGSFTEMMHHAKEDSEDSGVDFVFKLEPPWSMGEDQPSAVYSTVQPLPPGSPLSLSRGQACRLCSAAFVLVSSLELHVASVHGEQRHVGVPTSSTPEGCDAGDYRNMNVEYFASPAPVERLHVDSNDMHRDKERRRVCNVCSKAFAWACDLKRHQVIHDSQKPYVCDVCGKAFSQAGNLKTHKLIHANLNPFVCDMCHKAFTRADHLKEHQVIHSSHKPFVCDTCGKAFTTASSVKRHELLHTSHKPYVCEVCSKAFADVSSLKVHKRVHTGEKPFVCTDCGKGFTQSGILRNHCLIHTQQRPHCCPHCPAAFKQSGHLKRHVQNLHK